MNTLPPEVQALVSLIFGIIVLGVIVIDVILVLMYMFNRSAVIEGQKKPIFSATWSLVDVWMGGQAALLGIIILAIPVAIVLVVTTGAYEAPEKAQTAAFLIPFVGILLLIQNVILTAIPIAVITQKYKQTIQSIGFRLKPERHEVIIGLVSGVIVIFVSMGLEIVIELVGNLLFGHQGIKSVHETGKQLGNEAMIESSMKSPVWGLVMLIGGAIAAPIGEEFFFRAFLFNALKHRYKLPVAVCVSALIFALIHVAPLSVLVIFPMGIVLALSYYYTGSLWVPIIIHMTNNGVQLLFLYIYNLTVGK